MKDKEIYIYESHRNSQKDRRPWTCRDPQGNQKNHTYPQKHEFYNIETASQILYSIKQYHQKNDSIQGINEYSSSIF